MIFDKLVGLNVNEYTEKRSSGKDLQLTYLSWVWAVKKMTEVCPDWSYEIVRYNGLPYAYDPLTGYMVTTRVTADGQTKEMWLPVMDGANHAMKSEPYTLKTKYSEITVQPATMFDINKAIMRCLTKNLAMFGLGLYIYAGEDLPEDQKDDPKRENTDSEKLDVRQANEIIAKAREKVVEAIINAREKVMEIAETKAADPNELIEQRCAALFKTSFYLLTIEQLRNLYADLKGMPDV